MPEAAVHLLSDRPYYSACGRRFASRALRWPSDVVSVTCGACRRTKAWRAAADAFLPKPPPPPPEHPDPAKRVTWSAAKFGGGYEGRSADGWVVSGRSANHGTAISMHAIDPEKVSHCLWDWDGKSTPNTLLAMLAERYARIRANPELYSARRADEHRQRLRASGSLHLEKPA